MSEYDRMYFAQRAAEEERLAGEATDPHVIAAHKQLQRAYVEKASVGDRPHLENEVIG